MSSSNEKFVDNKSILQSYLNSFNQSGDGTTTVLTVNTDDDPEPEVTYFVDEVGRYYYQPAGGNQNLVSLPTETTDDKKVIKGEDSQIMVDGSGYQTVTLLPSEAGGGEVSYVLVVQEDTKPVVNIDIKAEKGNDVYKFEDEEDEDQEVGTDEDDGTLRLSKLKPAPVKKPKYQRSPFNCTFCSYTSPRRYLLVRHMKSHSQERPHKCQVCERGFKTHPSLQNHLNMHNGVKPHVCKYCNTPFTTSGELVRHVRYKHTHEKPHKCTECDYASVELSKLRRHVRCHTGERPYQCPHCTYASPDTFKLKRHLRTHTGEKPYKCDNCNMCFTQSNSLKAHKLIHNVSEKPVYKCELCPAKCGRKTDLRIHIQKLHTSDKPLKCKRCGKTFPDRYSCKMHNKTHEGEKCFKCELCPYASTTLRHLKSHMLKHTDEKPFVCDQCDQTFRQKQLLRRHQNLYHNPNYVPKPPKEKTHTCQSCKRVFAHKGNLIRHLAVHDPESGHTERSLALKMGRQKKVKFVNINSQSSEGESESETTDLVKLSVSDEEIKRGKLVTVADGDGQQYVVLEVIQLEDGTEQQVAVVAQDAYMESEGLDQDNIFVEEDDEAIEDEVVEEEEEEEEDEEINETKEIILHKKDQVPRETNNTIKLEIDMDSCFGFVEEEDADDEEYCGKVIIS